MMFPHLSTVESRGNVQMIELDAKRRAILVTVING